MSPLIDVTNTEIVTRHEDRSERVINPDTGKLSKLPANRNDCQIEEKSKNNSNGIRRQLKKTKLRTHLRSKSTKDAKVSEGGYNFHVLTQVPSNVTIQTSGRTQQLIVNPTQVNDVRVPPLPGVEFLSKAVETLSIASEDKWQPTPLVNKQTINSTINNKFISRSESHTQCPQDGKLPLEVCGGTYQCVACKLEFSNLDNLTAHLVKHIYEGLHAAAWLNSAMTTLLFPSAATTSSPTRTSSLVNTDIQFAMSLKNVQSDSSNNSN